MKYMPATAKYAVILSPGRAATVDEESQPVEKRQAVGRAKPFASLRVTLRGRLVRHGVSVFMSRQAKK